MTAVEGEFGVKCGHSAANVMQPAEIRCALARLYRLGQPKRGARTSLRSCVRVLPSAPCSSLMAADVVRPELRRSPLLCSLRWSTACPLLGPALQAQPLQRRRAAPGT